MTKLKSNEIVS